MNFLRRSIQIFHRIENGIMLVFLTALVLLAFGQVGGRMFFNIGFQEGDTIIYHLLLWIGLWGAILATREKEHITIDLVSRFVSGRGRYSIQAVTYLFSAVICGVLAWTSFRFVQDEAAFNTTTILGTPLWVFQTIIPYSFTVMSMRFFVFSVMEMCSAIRSPIKAEK